MKKYDGTYIFVNVGKDEMMDQQIERVCSEITRLNGVVLKVEVLGKRAFARPMQKKESGIYVKIRFELAPAQIDTLVSRYHLVDEVFRVQILAVDERLEQKLNDQTARYKAREAERLAAEEAERLAAEEAAAAAAESDAEEEDAID